MQEKEVIAQPNAAGKNSTALSDNRNLRVITRADSQQRISNHLEILDQALAQCLDGLSNGGSDLKQQDVYLRHLTRLIGLSSKLEDWLFRMNYLYRAEEQQESSEEKMAKEQQKTEQSAIEQHRELLDKLSIDKIKLLNFLATPANADVPLLEFLETLPSLRDHFKES